MRYVAIQKRDGSVKIFPGTMKGTPARDVCLTHGVDTVDEPCAECRGTPDAAAEAFWAAQDAAYERWKDRG